MSWVWPVIGLKGLSHIVHAGGMDSGFCQVIISLNASPHHMCYSHWLIMNSQKQWPRHTFYCCMLFDLPNFHWTILSKSCWPAVVVLLCCFDNKSTIIPLYNNELASMSQQVGDGMGDKDEGGEDKGHARQRENALLSVGVWSAENPRAYMEWRVWQLLGAEGHDQAQMRTNHVNSHSRVGNCVGHRGKGFTWCSRFHNDYETLVVIAQLCFILLSQIGSSRFRGLTGELKCSV